MPMYSGFDDRFDAAMANKLRNQDVHAGVEQQNAAANMMNAQTTRGLAPSQGFQNVGVANAALQNAGTNRAQIAGLNPMGFSANQVNSLGLRNFGINPTQQATANNQAVYGSGNQPSAFASMYQKAADTWKPGDPLLGNKGMAGGWGGARGGVMGDVDNDTGRDTQTVRARPGEYFLNPETITHGFGNGNYDHGVRNLDEIVRQSTGREPGATYSKKGKAGYAESGVVGVLEQARNARKPRGRKVQPPEDQGQSESPIVQGARRIAAGFPQLPITAEELPSRAAPAAQTTPNRLSDLIAQANRAQYPRNIVGGPMPRLDTAPLPPMQANLRDIPTASAVAEPAPAPAPAVAAPAAPAAPADRPFSQRAKAYGGPASALPALPTLTLPTSQRGRGYEQPPQVAAPNASQPAPPGTPRNPAPSGATQSTKDLFAQPATVSPSTTAITGLRTQTTPTPEQMRSEVMAKNIAEAPPPPKLYQEGQGVHEWDIRNKIQAGGRPGEQIAINYGAGHGMGPGAAPIIATANKAGRFNSFSNLPQLARSGVVPDNGLRDIPGFQDSGALFSRFGPGGSTVLPEGPAGIASRFGPGGSTTATAQVQNAAEAARLAAEAENLRNAQAAANVLRQAAPGAVAPPPAGPPPSGVYRAAEALGKGAGAGVRLAGRVLPTLAYTAPLTGFGDYKLNNPDVDSSLGGTLKYALTGEGGKVVESLKKGATEAGLDVISGLAKTVDAGTGLLGANQDLAGRFRKWNEENLGLSLLPQAGVAPPAAVKSQWADPAGFAPKPGTSVNPSTAQPLAQARPSMRDMMMLRAMALGGMGPGADAEQKNLLGYLGQVDAQTAAAGNAAARQTSQLASQHEKDIEASLIPRFKKQVVDDKGKTTEVDDRASYERFLADMATRNIPIFTASRADRDKALAEWQARKRVEDRINAIQTESGSPFQDQLTSQRTLPIGLRSESMGLGDWWGSPNIHIGDYGRSFLGGLRNRVATREVLDPATGKMVTQLYPAAKVFGDQPGTVDVDAMRYAQGR